MKTPVYIVRGRKQGAKYKPAFINGALRDRADRRIRKVLVYHFTEGGDLLVDLIPVRFVQPAVFELEG